MFVSRQQKDPRQLIAPGAAEPLVVDRDRLPAHGPTALQSVVDRPLEHHRVEGFEHVMERGLARRAIPSKPQQPRNTDLDLSAWVRNEPRP